MKFDRLFLHTLQDLEERTRAADEYKVLMSAALLRKLLLDTDRLVDQANRLFKLDLRFRISSVSPFEQTIYESNPMFWIIEDALDPELFPFAPAVDAKRDQFLARRVMGFDGTWMTVRDVIHQLANIEGAVHAGRAKERRQIAFQEAERFYSRGQLPGAISQSPFTGWRRERAWLRCGLLG